MTIHAFLIYLLKANAVLSVLFLAYLLLLKNLTFFGLNRVFLLAALLLSVLLPLAPPVPVPATDRLPVALAGMYPDDPFYRGISGPARGADPATAIVPPGNAAPGILAPADALPVGQCLAGLYAAVAGLLLARFGRQLYRVLGLIRGSRRQVGEGVTYCEHDGPLPPFSFFGYLVLNPAAHSGEQLQQVVAHEKVHIRQGHTADILLAEAVQILLWVNPLVYWLKKHLKLNLEYIADRRVLDAGTDKQQYQWAILRSTAGPVAYALTNPFHASKLKLRIKMMNTRQSPTRHLYKYAFVLPLAALLVLLVNGCERGPVRTPEAKNAGLYKSPLQVFEGYYKFQFRPGEDSYFKITPQGDGLVLKELWSGQQMTFNRKSELAFIHADDETFPLQFTKDKDGAITGVLAMGEDAWTRADGYRPVTRNVVQLPAGKMQAYAGYYRSKNNPEAVLQITDESDGLVVKELWNGKQHRFVAGSETEFWHQDPEVTLPLTFTRDNTGAITQVQVLKENGLWTRTDDYKPRTEISLPAAQLKAYEGRYEMSEGPPPGYYIQITTKDNGLVLKESWSGNEIPFVPETEVDFFSKKRPFPLKFTKGVGGTVTHVLAFNRDLWTKVK